MALLGLDLAGGGMGLQDALEPGPDQGGELLGLFHDDIGPVAGQLVGEALRVGVVEVQQGPGLVHLADRTCPAPVRTRSNAGRGSPVGTSVRIISRALWPGGMS